MHKKNISAEFWLVILLGVTFLLFFKNVSVWAPERSGTERRGGQSQHREAIGEHHWAGSIPPRYETFEFRGSRYHYHEGRFYRPWWFGYTVVAPPIGAVVTVLPNGTNTCVVGGGIYYCYEDTYYTPYPGGYVVVTPPDTSQNVTSTSTAPQQTPTGATVIINVPNSSGGYTAVRLIKRDVGYVGPQGEFYPDYPTVDQLRVLYGK